MMAPLINRWKQFVFSWIKLFYRRSEVVFVFDVFVPSPSSQMKNSSRTNSPSWVSRSTLSTFPASRYVERHERGEAEGRGALERWGDEQKINTANNRNTDQILLRDPSGKLHQKNQRGVLWCLITCTWKGGGVFKKGAGRSPEAKTHLREQQRRPVFGRRLYSPQREFKPWFNTETVERWNMYFSSQF